MKIFLLTVGVLFFCLEAVAAEEIRLDLSPSMQPIPVMDQGSEGTCYAHAGVQLIDAYRFSHGDTDTEHLSSPIHLAVASLTESVKMQRELKGSWSETSVASGHYLWKILHDARSAGSCDDFALRSFFLTGKGKSIEEGIRKALELNLRSTDWFSRAMTYARHRTSTEEKTLCDLYKAFPSQRLELMPSLAAVERALNAPYDGFAGMNEIVKGVCETKTKPLNDLLPPPTILARSEENDATNSFIRATKAVLQSPKPQPVGISYCADVLTTANFQGLHADGSEKKQCNMHASVVVGYRESHGRDFFLVRNSWGGNCSRYAWECEKGQIWVPAKELMSNTSSLVYFGEKNPEK